jgi:hypothetical protein
MHSTIATSPVAAPNFVLENGLTVIAALDAGIQELRVKPHT